MATTKTTGPVARATIVIEYDHIPDTSVTDEVVEVAGSYGEVVHARLETLKTYTIDLLKR